MRILISAGETSGDLHGSKLVEALRKRVGKADFYCFGGKRLARAGAESLYPLAEQGIMGFWEVLRNWRHVRDARSAAIKFLKTKRPDVVVPIDYPGFNIRLAGVAKGLGIPVVYYISPQVWAWHRSRIKTLGKVVDKILVIFPFEKNLYEEAGIPVEFVGHPLLDVLADVPFEDDGFRGLSVGLLPGSRPMELENHLPAMVGAARRIHDKIDDVRFILPIAEGINADTLMNMLDKRFGLRIDEAFIDEDPEMRLSHGPLPVGIGKTELEVILVRDPGYLYRNKMHFAITASGTATLENAILGIPMVVVYRTGRITFALAKRLVRVDHIGLVNLVAGRRICPELIQNDVNSKRIFDESMEILGSPDRYAEIKEALYEVRGRLGESGASDNAAEAVLSVLGSPRRGISL